MKLYKYWDYIGSLSDIESHVEYYENNNWNCEPVPVNADIIRMIDTKASPNVQVLIKNIRSRYNINSFKDIIATNKKNAAIEAAKDLGYNEIYIKTLDLYTYLWRCERVI